MDKKDKKEYKEQAKLADDLASESEKQLDEDFDRIRQNRSSMYPSMDDPDEIIGYKRMRLIPESSVEFQGLIDKDVVLANIKAKLPDPELQKFMAETISIFKKVFVVKKRVFLTDETGKMIPKYAKDANGKVQQIGFESEEILVFDKNFEPVLEFLHAGFKYEHVASRAMGEDRESVLDRSVKLEKGVRRREEINRGA